MRDKISIERINLIHPILRGDIIQAINNAELQLPTSKFIRVVQGLRTISEQNSLYAQGRTRKGPIVTNAKGGQSLHNYGLAVDLAIITNNGKEVDWDYNDPALKQLRQELAGKSWDWGGNWHSFKDYPHYEKLFGLSLRQIQARYTADNTFIDPTNGQKYINLP